MFVIIILFIPQNALRINLFLPEFPQNFKGTPDGANFVVKRAGIHAEYRGFGKNFTPN